MNGNYDDIKHLTRPQYVDKQGVVRIYDSYSQELVFTDKSRINIQDIIRIEFKEDLQ